MGRGRKCPRARADTRGGPDPVIRRPMVTVLLAVALLATLTVTAFAVSLPDVSAPTARDLPKIVTDEVLATPSSGVSTVPAHAGPTASTSADSTSTAGPVSTATGSSGHKKSGGTSSASHPASNHGSAGSSGQGSGNNSGSGSGNGGSNNGSGNGGHDSHDREVVHPHLHESDGNEHNH